MQERHVSLYVSLCDICMFKRRSEMETVMTQQQFAMSILIIHHILW